MHNHTTKPREQANSNMATTSETIFDLYYALKVKCGSATYEGASSQYNPYDSWVKAYTVLSAARATPNNTYTRPRYRHEYWILDDVIFRRAKHKRRHKQLPEPFALKCKTFSIEEVNFNATC